MTDKIQKINNEINPYQSEMPKTRMNRMIRQRMTHQKQQDSKKNLSVTERQYFKSADFKKLQIKFEETRKYHITLTKFLRISLVNASIQERRKTRKLTEKCYEHLQESLNDFTTMWEQTTSGFIGTRDEIKQVYRLIIDDLKAILSIANPPNRNKMETVVLALNHTLEWLLAQAFPNSAGATANAIHPELYQLELVQQQTQGMASAANMNRSFLGGLRDKLPWVRSKSPYEKSEGSGLPFLPDQGGVE